MRSCKVTRGRKVQPWCSGVNGRHPSHYSPLETVLGADPGCGFLVLLLVPGKMEEGCQSGCPPELGIIHVDSLLGFRDHALDVLLGETPLVVGDGDLAGLCNNENGRSARNAK